MEVIPQPLTEADRAAGYTFELSMNQIEFSKTLVLDRPGRARAFFEHAISEGVGLGRPSEVELAFSRRVQRNTPGLFRTRIVTEGVEPRVSIHYKHSRVKQYLIIWTGTEGGRSDQGFAVVDMSLKGLRKGRPALIVRSGRSPRAHAARRTGGPPVPAALGSRLSVGGSPRGWRRCVAAMTPLTPAGQLAHA